MPPHNGTLSIKLKSEEGLKIRRALSADQRVKVLALLGNRAMNINEIAAGLGVSQPTASVHIRVLEEAGLVECEYAASSRGSEKRCWAKYDSLLMDIRDSQEPSEESVEELAMPIGLFSSVSITPTCGLASEERIIGFLDNPQSFLLPSRADAQILWFAGGWVEYTFPFDLPPTAEVLGLELMAEVCSEAPNYDHEWPSDITVWVNGMDIGTWTSPEDFGGRRGRLNPDWWSDTLTQFGALKSWNVNRRGCYIDGNRVGSHTISEIGLAYGCPITIRLGNKADAVHKGGVNLFGRHFGNYPQDLVLRIRYRLRTSEQVAARLDELLGSHAGAETSNDSL